MKAMILMWAALVPVVTAEVGTVVHPEEAFDPATSVVWSTLFQVDWDRMEGEIGGGVMRVSG